MGYWDGVKGRWNEMVEGRLPMEDPPPVPPAEPLPGPPAEDADLIRGKFRQWMGREPYSDQELIDWWQSLG